MRPIALCLLAFAAVGSPAAAQEASPPGECPAPQAPGGELGAWTSPVNLVSAKEASRLTDTKLRLDQASELVLHPIGTVRLPVPAGRAGGNGGLASIAIAKEGTYRVALGSAAWVDLVAAGKAVPSTSHGHGPPCTGIRKIVEFRLKPGRYTIVISGNLEMRTRLLVAKEPG